ncbi:MAG: phosphoribosyltransferase [Acetobacteraceae bacterium]|nr:phosphoribosyltransferase [Acetobacteraceae bacterium]
MRQRWTDRREAGRALAAALQRLAPERPIVLALPRGGVPVAFEVARALAAPLDVLLVRKVGAPMQKEFGMGAVAEGPIVLMDEALVRMVSPPPGYVEAEIERELAEMARRREHYAGARQRADVVGRTVLLIDDGIATGGTARAALRALRERGAAKVVLAVPIAAPESLARLRTEADEVVCLEAPQRMSAVGNAYVDFSPTADAEVVDLLRRAASGDEP